MRGRGERIHAAARIEEVHFAALEAKAIGMIARRDHVFMGGELRQPEFFTAVTSSAGLRAIMAHS